MRLSKSQYIRGLQCHKSLWLYRHRRDLIPETPPALQAIFDAGHAVGELAWQRFPGGRLIEEDHLHLPEAAEATRAAVKAGERTLYEAAAIFDGVAVRPDILTRKKSAKAWDLIEVKGATAVKDVYLDDVAVQRYVFEGAGYPIRRTYLMHVNNKYVRDGDIDVGEYFTLEDITGDIAPLMREVPSRVKELHGVLAKKDVPDIGIGKRCHDPYDCEFIHHCWDHVPDYSVYDLTHARWDKIDLLLGMDVLHVKDIPLDFKLSKAQQLQVLTERSGKPHIEPDPIRDMLKGLEYPLYYLDFETVNPAIPPYDGLKAYQQTPFQASLHVRKRPKGPVKHLEYLGDPAEDPRPGLVEFLLEGIGAEGTLVAYNAGFEAGRLKELAEAYPKHGERLLAMASRLWDLAEPFRKRLYVHPEFHGRYSIKAVLPALVRGMSYDGMEIGEGGEASLAYQKLMQGKLDKAGAGKLTAALREYCAQDTLAMVKLHEVLERL